MVGQIAFLIGIGFIAGCIFEYRAAAVRKVVDWVNLKAGSAIESLQKLFHW